MKTRTIIFTLCISSFNYQIDGAFLAKKVLPSGVKFSTFASRCFSSSSLAKEKSEQIKKLHEDKESSEIALGFPFLAKGVIHKECSVVGDTATIVFEDARKHIIEISYKKDQNGQWSLVSNLASKK